MEKSWKLTPIKNIVTMTNYVGTKCLVAQWADQYKMIGMDVVNININDLLSNNSIPYGVTLNISMLNDTSLKIIDELKQGFLFACNESNIQQEFGALATLPEILKKEFPRRTFNIIGFGIGLIEPNISTRVINEDNLLIGIESNGLHCNGFTLARKTLLDKWSNKNDVFSKGDIFSPTGKKIEDELLRPTFSYKSVVDILTKNRIEINGLANISRLGITGLWNLMAIHNIGFEIDSFLEIPPIFLEIQKRGNIDSKEMFRVFNMGVGFYLVVNPQQEHNVLKLVKKIGFRAYTVGKVVNSQDIKILLENEELVFEKPDDWIPH